MTFGKTAFFRFYEELNDFLPADKRKVQFRYAFSGNPAIKDAVEAIGVPHTEVDLILVNGGSVDFSYHLNHGDRVSVYPVFESFDIRAVTHLRPGPLRNPKFILDVHLGKLAKLLRMLGFDTMYRNDLEDEEIAERARQEGRTILTRDVGLLKRSSVDRGYWVRSQQPKQQAREVIHRFDLKNLVNPFKRCLDCNGIIEPVEKEAVEEQLPPASAQSFSYFFQCSNCGKLYWRGSHVPNMLDTICSLIGEE